MTDTVQNQMPEKNVSASSDHLEGGAGGNKIEKVDTIHNDEALKVVADYDGDAEWTEQEERRLRRKVDWKLMPILCFSYMLQYYDKAMLGQAALFGIIEELDLQGRRYSWSSSIFYLGFIAGAWPSMIIAQRYPIERVTSGLICVWGICLLLTITCSSFQGLYAQRFFLGMLESGISPIFMLVVGSWYKKNEQAFRMGIWYSMTGYSALFSPLINYGLGHAHGALSPWKYMYIFAGSITVVWGIILYFILPANPLQAKGLDKRERYIAVARLRTNNNGIRNTHFKMGQVVELLLDPKFWLLFAFALLAMICNGPISTFIPIIIRGFGFSTLNSLLLFIPAGVYAGTLMLIVPYLARVFPGWRVYLIILCESIATLACFLLWFLPKTERGALLFACYILPSVGASYAVAMGLNIANTAGYTKRSVSSAGLFVGYCIGNFIGPLLFKAEESPKFGSAWAAVVGTTLASIVCIMLYGLACVWDNRRRDRMGSEGFEHAYEDDLTDVKNQQFRYVY